MRGSSIGVRPARGALPEQRAQSRLQPRRRARPVRTAPEHESAPSGLWRAVAPSPAAPSLAPGRERQRQALIRLGALVGNRHLQRLLSTAGGGPTAVQRATPEPEGKTMAAKDATLRFEGDKKLERIFAGSEVLKKGASGIPVVKLQQALVDLGYPLPKSGVNGKFEDETEAAIKKFQADRSVTASGELDKATLEEMKKVFETRKPYLGPAAKFDPADPTKGTRPLGADEKKAVEEALVPPRGVGGSPATFTEVVAGKKYGDRIKGRLTTLIAALHKELYKEKEPLRADPGKNFHDWKVLENTAEAAKEQTDALYGSYATGPKMTHLAGNFVDQWEDELVRNAALSDKDKKEKAVGKVWYLIASNCEDINEEHSAVPTDTKEKVILTPIVESFVATKAKVQTLLDLDIGWEGAQLEGVVYLQRYKKETGAKNRAQLWGLFHTCIHEYIHSLAHADYKKYAEKFYSKGDTVRYNTLVEGFCDFFTENVRKIVTVTDALRKKVEGPYYDAAAAVPAIRPGVYPSIAQAEQVVSIVGIRNAQAAYFQGKVALIGK